MKQRLVYLIMLLPFLAFGKAEFYRVSWRSDPATSAVICWNQASGTNPEVCYDTVDHARKAIDYRCRQTSDRVVEYRGMTNHFARLEDLEPDTAYYFVICDSEGVGRRLWFRTAPATPQPFTFISGGDSRTNPAPRRDGNKLVAKLRPLFVLFGGDYTGSGTPDEWREWLEDWQLTISEDGRITPIIAAHGNHENADMQMMTKLFDTPHPDQYFALNIGGNMMRIWVLNSELEYKDPEGKKIATQNDWIRDDLPRHPDVTWKLAAFHRPMRAHTSHKSEGLNRIKWWSTLFYDQGMDLVIESDTHMVKHTYPVRPSVQEGSYESFIRDDQKGTVFIGEGSWGAPRRPADDDKPWTMASESFYQYKWIQAFPEELLIRTVKFDDADEVVPLTDDTLFEEPQNMTFWEPESGKILRLPFDSSHPTYTEPALPEVLFERGQVWESSLDGIHWVRGVAPLGYGDDKVRTEISSTPPHPLFAFFRREFFIEDPTTISRLFFDTQVDDGCIIRLNGQEVKRHNMPGGEPTAATVATRRVGGWMERWAHPFPIDPKFLKPGVNRIDVRVHQCEATSSDLIFDLSVRVKR